MIRIDLNLQSVGYQIAFRVTLIDRIFSLFLHQLLRLLIMNIQAQVILIWEPRRWINIGIHFIRPIRRHNLIDIKVRLYFLDLILLGCLNFRSTFGLWTVWMLRNYVRLIVVGRKPLWKVVGVLRGLWERGMMDIGVRQLRVVLRVVGV